MRCTNSLRRAWLPTVLAHACLVAPVVAQSRPAAPQPSPNRYAPYRSTGQPQPGRAQQQPAYRVAERSKPSPENALPDYAIRRPDEHPLMPAIRWAYAGLRELENIRDYSATMVKRERINGKLNPPEYMFLKIRHKPLSVYMCFLDPPHLKGQEVIWIENHNDGKLSGHGVGFKKIFGTVSLEPTGPIAMQGNRYPITEIGILNLVRRLIEVAENDAQYGECEVKFFPGAKINGRSCTCIQVVHPFPRRNFLFHLARIFVDDEYNLPTRYEAYEWPSEPGGRPILLEEYTYLDLKFNRGFTDADFDIRNPNYQFTSAAR